MQDYQNNNKPKDKTCQYGILYKTDISSLKGATSSEALVYMTYILHASKDKRTAFPSYKTIMNLTGLSRSSVLRAVRKLQDKGLLTKYAMTPTGVNIYQLLGVTNDTPVKDDTRVSTDTRVKGDTPPSVKGDTTPVSEVTPITSKATEKNNNCFKLANKNDEKYFSLLWQKWNDSPLCLWKANNPLQEYIHMRDRVLALWKHRGYEKDLSYELQIIDIYLMDAQANITQGKQYTGHARLWAGAKWTSGIEKWLSSSTPSYLSPKRKQYISRCIRLTVTEEDTTKTSSPEQAPPSREEDNMQIYIQQLEALYDDAEDNNRGYKAVFLEHYQNTPFPPELRKDTHFYEYFYTIDEVLGENNG